MRKVLLALLLIAPAAYAQPKTSFSVFLSQVNIAYSPTTGHHWYSDYGAGVETVFTPRFSLQASVTSERRSSRPYVVDETGYINQVPPVSFRTYPIDLTARYRFVNESRWKPFLGLGVRYVAAPHVDSMFGYSNRWTPEATGGVIFQMRHLGIVLEGKALLGDHEYYDSVLKSSIGLNWRF